MALVFERPHESQKDEQKTQGKQEETNQRKQTNLSKPTVSVIVEDPGNKLVNRDLASSFSTLSENRLG